jgi:hypothetical protein
MVQNPMEIFLFSQGPNCARYVRGSVCATGIVVSTLRGMTGLFRSRIGTLVVVTLLVVGGIGGWVFMEKNAQAMLWNRTEAKADELSQAYISMIRERLPLLKAAAGSSDVQQAGIRTLEDVTTEVISQENASIVHKLQGITRLQVSIATALSVADNRQLESGPFHDMQQAVGDRGPLSTIIEEYNALAREWNQRSASFLGSLAAGMSQPQASPLPYLRVDGVDEALMINI